MANGSPRIYAPTAYSQEYNKMLLDQITRPIREQREHGIQAIKEAFARTGGYGGAAPLSSIRKLMETTGEQIGSAATQVGLAGAGARHQELLTEMDRLWQSQEREKLREFNEYMTRLGFGQQERMLELQNEYQKDLMARQQEIIEQSQPGPWENILANIAGTGTELGLYKLFGL